MAGIQYAHRNDTFFSPWFRLRVSFIIPVHISPQVFPHLIGISRLSRIANTCSAAAVFPESGRRRPVILSPTRSLIYFFGERENLLTVYKMVIIYTVGVMLFLSGGRINWFYSFL